MDPDHCLGPDGRPRSLSERPYLKLVYATLRPPVGLDPSYRRFPFLKKRVGEGFFHEIRPRLFCRERA